MVNTSDSEPCEDVALTPRQTEVVDLAAQGLSYKETAKRLRISPRTVEAHLSAARSRLAARSTGELIAWYSRSQQ
jgi:DNA-binding CsgD family transcriptional regulator